MTSFRNIDTLLMLVITKSTDKKMARQVSYLKAENQILRSRLPARIILTQREKNRLIRFAKNLGSALNELATIVHPSTIRVWIREQSGNKKKQPKRGRPRTAEQIEKLIVKLAKDTDWGYTRILGELKKLGVQSVTRNTVKNILKRNVYETGPKRAPGMWDEFIKRHAKTMWQCDLFSKKIVSRTGLLDVFVLVFLNIETRRVYISPATYKPDQAWMVEQAEAFIRHTKSERLSCKILMHDNDGKYSKPFLAVFADQKIKTQRTALRSPNTVAFVERFAQTIEQECLDRFIVFGEAHVSLLCTEFGEHYHRARPHQSLENELIQKPLSKTGKKSGCSVDSIRISDIRCQERLGGMLKSYSRRAA
ncbi:Integrase core domain protein [Planctomycetes bacterium CA13]|uniref:Integrase core domain protein n=1 Tax=Novipirellula herctigrandis TaxID=2527986 RepID=A0A5C5ZBN0_9BACT|nr:Integrase core domain protein [Planctomycetes bacterium CA13]